MFKKTTAMIALMALTAASAHAATTIDADGFNLSYLGGMSNSAFDMTLLSDVNGTARIGLDLGLPSFTQSEYPQMDFVMHQLSGAIRDGYRVTSITLSADVTGALYVQPLESCHGCIDEFAGAAENAARLDFTVTPSGGSWSNFYDKVLNVNGSAQLVATSPGPLAGSFYLELNADNSVYPQRGWQQTPAGDIYYDRYYDAWASIDVSNIVLTVQVSPVPEPGTYAMLLAGLGVAGWAARRRPT